LANAAVTAYNWGLGPWLHCGPGHSSRSKCQRQCPPKTRVYLANNVFPENSIYFYATKSKMLIHILQLFRSASMPQWTILADFKQWPRWQNQSSVSHSPPGVDCVLWRRLHPVLTSCVQEPAVSTVTWSLMTFTWPVSMTRGGALKARLRWRLTSIWPSKHYINHCQ